MASPITVTLTLPLITSGPPSVGDIFGSVSIQSADAGVKFIVQVVDQSGNPVNLSTATGLTCLLLYPDEQTEVSVAAAFNTDGTDGRLTFTAQAGSIYQDGFYGIQAQFSMSGGVTLTTVMGNFWAYPTLSPGGTPPQPSFNSSAVILFDSSNVRWALMVTPAQTFQATAMFTGPTNAITLSAFVLQDSNGIYWTITMQTNGQYLATQGGTYQQAIESLILTDTNGHSWVVTISTAGVLVAS